ncbi:MAG: hypothetical protein RLZZ40_890 [Actinomycetota bacterium]
MVPLLRTMASSPAKPAAATVAMAYSAVTAPRSNGLVSAKWLFMQPEWRCARWSALLFAESVQGCYPIRVGEN